MEFPFGSSSLWLKCLYDSPFLDLMFQLQEKLGADFMLNILILGLKVAICSTFKEAGVNWEPKLIAEFSADGASANLGKKAGLATLLCKEVPYLVDFHCSPHPLELTLLELQNSCKFVEDVYNVLNLIWNTYHYSPKSVLALKFIAYELQINILKPTQVTGRGTFWLPNISQALEVFVGSTAKSAESSQHSAMLMHMEDLSVNSKVPDIQGRAPHIGKIKEVHFAAFCHF